ncbi:hypothetical protein ACOMHN_031020 [Nucella lapillus]
MAGRNTPADHKKTGRKRPKTDGAIGNADEEDGAKTERRTMEAGLWVNTSSGQGSMGQEFGSPAVHSPAYLLWKRLGAQQGLHEDSDIACFLLKYYEDTSRVFPAGLTGVCRTCSTPLSISCTCCDWIVHTNTVSSASPLHGAVVMGDPMQDEQGGNNNDVRGGGEDFLCHLDMWSESVVGDVDWNEEEKARAEESCGTENADRRDCDSVRQTVKVDPGDDDDPAIPRPAEDHTIDSKSDSCHGLPVTIKQEYNDWAPSSGDLKNNVKPDVSHNDHQRCEDRVEAHSGGLCSGPCTVRGDGASGLVWGHHAEGGDDNGCSDVHVGREEYDEGPRIVLDIAEHPEDVEVKIEELWETSFT